MAKMTIEGTPKQIEIGIAALCPRCSRLTVEGVMLAMHDEFWRRGDRNLEKAARAVIAYVKEG